MIEAGANEVPEQTVIDAIFKAHEVNQEIIRFIDTIVAECGKETVSYTHLFVATENEKEARSFAETFISEEMCIRDRKYPDI